MQIEFVESTSPDDAPVLEQNVISRNLGIFAIHCYMTLP